MKKLNDEERDALLDKVLEMTGGKSCIVIVNDEVVPCPEKVEKGRCSSGHLAQYFHRGFGEENFALGLLAQILDSGKGSIPSPYK